MERSPPFLIDYTHHGRRYSFALAAPTSWAEAEAHLVSIRETAKVEGSDLVEIEGRVIDELMLLADLVLARLAARGEAARMMEAGAAMLAAAATLAGGGRDDTRAEALAVTLLQAAGAAQ
ncbi:hypothetical protein [Polymorphobacter sp.]|uniref:hypothetical protein n=1 Tax=Polymorphobacter sp. TaxID=1909290 RepID=UPI003F7121A9